MKRTNKNAEAKSKSPSGVTDVQPKELASVNDQIPAGLEFMADIKSPVEFLNALFPELKNLDGMAAIFSGMGLDLQITVPQWATLAAKKFWEGFGFAASHHLADGNLLEIGKWIGFIEEIKTSEDAPITNERAETFMSVLCAFAKTQASNASAEEAKKFFDERATGKKLLEKAKFSPQRTRVFLVIAAAWRKVEEFKSAGEFHRFLLAEKVILPMTDAAETRKVCQIIGLKFESKAGRPPKQINPVTP